MLLAVGAAYASRVKRWYATYLLIAFAVAGPAFAWYSNAKLTEETTRSILERFFLMPRTIVAPLAGFAILAAAEHAAAVRIPRRAAELGLATVGVLAALALVPVNYRVIEQSENHVARTFGNDLLRTMKPGSIFFGGGNPVVYSVQYLRTIENARAARRGGTARGLRRPRRARRRATGPHPAPRREARRGGRGRRAGPRPRTAQLRCHRPDGQPRGAHLRHRHPFDAEAGIHCSWPAGTPSSSRSAERRGRAA